ncbi:PREDICTED: protein NYNRIN-like [Brassica oleracea var. oleracea]|uniref:protein NYNRIN-like n=1 Tax=Brassica oleracea var. oleracea TaxID=109376 RepID=UPI0006A6CE2C|nr:PREDICTED: protein NYNRIN-like [Brassica oleracea var. oleracea]
MAVDADRQAKHCDQCQRHAPVSKLPPENLKSISSPWPIRKRGMDIVGKFPMATGHKVFLLVVTDYFPKWVKAEALSRITYLKIRKFLWTYVIARFGVPHEIVTDNGPQFTSHNFKEFCKD